jgi:hypothetical protein
MWKSFVFGAMSVPCSIVAFALGWAVAGVRMGIIYGLAVLLVCWTLAAVTLLFTRRVSPVDVFLPIPIAIVWSLLMMLVSAGADVFTAPACIGSAILLSACLWMIRAGHLPAVWAVFPAIVFAYEMLPINIPGPFDDWFAFGGDVTVLLWQGAVFALRRHAAHVAPDGRVR